VAKHQTLSGDRRRELLRRPGSQADETMLSPEKKLWHDTAYLLFGLVGLAAVTGLYFWLGFPPVSAAFTYLILIVFLSLWSLTLLVYPFQCRSWFSELFLCVSDLQFSHRL
jgi:hypothetical protein